MPGAFCVFVWFTSIPNTFLNFLYLQSECNGIDIFRNFAGVLWTPDLIMILWKHCFTFWSMFFFFFPQRCSHLSFSLVQTQWPWHHSVPIFFISWFYMSHSGGMCEWKALKSKLKKCQFLCWHAVHLHMHPKPQTNEHLSESFRLSFPTVRPCCTFLLPLTQPSMWSAKGPVICFCSLIIPQWSHVIHFCMSFFSFCSSVSLQRSLALKVSVSSILLKGRHFTMKVTVT